MALPTGAHTVRICPHSLLADNGEITATCFEPHLGSDTRHADGFLSVHWLEYLGVGSFPECLERLRNYLLNSPYPKEFKPTRQGKLAVLS
jgi:hypothetical protein